MPQLDLFTFTSQFFWLVIGFWGLYAGSFLNFILPFAFIIKVREYLSIHTVNTVSNSLLSKKTMDVLNRSYASLNVATKAVNTRFVEDISNLRTVASNSINSLRDDSVLAAVRTYISLSAITNLLLANRAVSTTARFIKTSKNAIKNAAKKSISSDKNTAKSSTPAPKKR